MLYSFLQFFCGKSQYNCVAFYFEGGSSFIKNLIVKLVLFIMQLHCKCIFYISNTAQLLTFVGV